MWRFGGLGVNRIRNPAVALLAALLAGSAISSPAYGQTHSEADVRFMQHMVIHHAQALEMAELVADRTENEQIRRLADRIEVSQKDEIAQMQRWLRARGEDAPEIPAADAERHHHHQHHGDHGHHGHGGQHAHHHHHRPGSHEHALMPGMLSAEQLAALRAARGAEFDRLFLELMIQHHEGALVMVAELFASPGAAQETEIFRFASDVDADQRAEIARMRRMLGG